MILSKHQAPNFVLFGTGDPEQEQRTFFFLLLDPGILSEHETQIYAYLVRPKGPVDTACILWCVVRSRDPEQKQCIHWCSVLRKYEAPIWVMFGQKTWRTDAEVDPIGPRIMRKHKALFHVQVRLRILGMRQTPKMFSSGNWSWKTPNNTDCLYSPGIINKHQAHTDVYFGLAFLSKHDASIDAHPGSKILSNYQTPTYVLFGPWILNILCLIRPKQFRDLGSEQ